MKNKILILVQVPILEKNYDIYIPVNKNIGMIKKDLEQLLEVQTDKIYKANPETNLYNKETGELFDNSLSVIDSRLKNGSRVILM